MRIINWLKRLLLPEPPALVHPPVRAHWVPWALGGEAFCGADEPGVYAIDAGSFLTMRDQCEKCSRGARTRLTAHRIKNR